MSADTHYQVLPPLTDKGEELIRYACLEKPCFDNDVIIHSDQLDRHATTIHGSSGISVDGRARVRHKNPTPAQELAELLFKPNWGVADHARAHQLTELLNREKG